MNDIGMNLAEPTKHHVTGVDSRLEAAAVFENIFLPVPPGKTKIQDFFTSKIAYAAGPRAESMNEPGDSCERGGFENAQGAILALPPASCGRGTRCCVASGPAASFEAVRGERSRDESARNGLAARRALGGSGSGAREKRPTDAEARR